MPNKLNQHIYTISLDESCRQEPKCKLQEDPLLMLVEGNEIIASLYKENLVSTFSFEGRKKEMFTANVKNAARLSSC